jgi:hypothetical protein
MTARTAIPNSAIAAAAAARPAVTDPGPVDRADPVATRIAAPGPKAPAPAVLVAMAIVRHVPVAQAHPAASAARVAMIAVATAGMTVATRPCLCPN